MSSFVICNTQNKTNIYIMLYYYDADCACKTLEALGYHLLYRAY